MKQIFTILAVIVVLSGIGIAAYFLFFAHSAPHLEVGNGANSFNTAVSNSQTATSSSTTNVVGGAGTLVAPGLVEVTKDAVALGVSVFNTAAQSSATTSSSTPASADIVVHYIDRASGNVFEYTVFGRTLTRIGNKTLPGIQTASWVRDGSLALTQFISDTNNQEHVETYALPATGTGGYFLQQDLSQATVVGSSTLFTLANNGGTTVGTLAKADGSGSHTLFSTPLTSLRVFQSGTEYVAAPKAANSLAGYAFAINTAGTLTPILGPFNGLSILPSPSGKSLLFSYISGSTVHVAVLDRISGSITTLPLATLAEKCTWIADSSALYCAIPTSLSGTLPDDWYQGAVSFSDRVWKIDLQTRLATLVMDPQNLTHAAMDIVNLTVDQNTHALVFRNKLDSSLWVFNL